MCVRGTADTTRRDPAYVSIRQHTSAYVSIRQHTSAYDSTGEHPSADTPALSREVTRTSSLRPHALVNLLCLAK
jgi:hypothetical protein